MLHACRGGLTVMLLPLLVSSLAPLGPSTMAVTAVAVLAVPTTAVIEPDARTIVQRSAYRLVGCALGALMGLFCLYWVGSNFLVWLLLLMAGNRDRLCRGSGGARVSAEHDPGPGSAAFSPSGARSLRRNNGGTLRAAGHHDGNVTVPSDGAGERTGLRRMVARNPLVQDRANPPVPDRLGAE